MIGQNTRRRAEEIPYLSDVLFPNLRVLGVYPCLDVLEIGRGFVVDVRDLNFLGNSTLHGQRVLQLTIGNEISSTRCHVRGSHLSLVTYRAIESILSSSVFPAIRE